MKNKDVTKIIQGIVAIVVGVLIAVLGIGAVMNTYLAILAIVAGSILVLLAFYTLYDKKVLPLSPLALGGALISIGVGVFVDYISFNVLIYILVFSLFGVGTAFIIFGVYVAAKGKVPFGVAFMIIGGALIALAACYLAFEDFRKIFWLIAGILIAVYGVLMVVLALTEKKRK